MTRVEHVRETGHPRLDEQDRGAMPKGRRHQRTPVNVQASCSSYPAGAQIHR
jgi:hypothetical protein